MSSKGVIPYTANAARISAYGHQDWRIPTLAELNVLFNNRAAIGGFNLSGSNPSGWYWSATPHGSWHAWGQRFSDRYQVYYDEANHSSVRLVRAVRRRPSKAAEAKSEHLSLP